MALGACWDKSCKSTDKVGLSDAILIGIIAGGTITIAASVTAGREFCGGKPAYWRPYRWPKSGPDRPADGSGARNPRRRFLGVGVLQTPSMTVATADPPAFRSSGEAIGRDTPRSAPQMGRSRFDIDLACETAPPTTPFWCGGEAPALIDTSHANSPTTWLTLLEGQIDPATIRLL